MRTWERWVAASFGTAGLIVLCVAYVDRPLAQVLGSLGPLRRLLWDAPVETPIFVIIAGAAIVFSLGRRFSERPAAPGLTVATVAAMALLASLAVTEYALKPIFGRVAPSAYIYHGRYGFHWFGGGEARGSFPSAHAAEAAAALSVLWAAYPRWRRACGAALLAYLFLMMVGQWHYFSDLVAGLYVGVVSAAVTARAWQTISLRFAPNS